MPIARRMKAKRQIKVIAVTAYTENQVIKEARLAGFTQVITKPVSYESLKQVIDDYMWFADI